MRCPARFGALVLLALAACGGKSGPPPRTVVLIAVDDLRADHLPAYGYQADPAPRLSRLAAKGTVFADHVTSSTATNAALASLSTGLDVDHHGVRSLQDVGRHRLPLACSTLAEEFAEQGFATVAAVSLRQLAGRQSGLQQGFDAYLDAGLPANGEALPAADVTTRLVAGLGEAIAADRPVFAMLHLGDLRDPEPSSSSLVAQLRLRFAARHLTPSDELERVLGSVIDPTVDVAAEIARLVGRKRGSPEWVAHVEARYDAALSDVDAAVGQLLDFLDETDRLDGAELIVVGTRGCYLTEPRPDGELEGFSEGLIRTVCLLSPRIGEVARVEFPTDARDVAAVLRAADRALPLREAQVAADRGERFGLVDSPRVGTRAIVASDEKAWPTMQGNEGQIVRRTDDAPVEWAASPDDRLALRTAARAPRDGFVLELAPDWELRSPRAALLVSLDRPPPAVEGHVPYALHERDLAVVVRATGAYLPVLPIPCLPADRGEAWEHDGDEPPPWVVDVAKTSGRKCAVTVLAAAGRAGDAVRVYVARYPGGDGPEALEVTAGAAVSVLSEPTLPGAVVVEGTLPFRVEIERPSGARLALAVRVGEAFVDPARMRYLGAPFVLDAIELYLPPWLPARMDWFLGEEPPSADASATIDFHRPGEAPVMEGRLGLTLDEARFLRRLGKNE